MARPQEPPDAPGQSVAVRGRFIVLEGSEGSGKSTQARMLADRLGAVLTHEPGATPVGAQLRSILLATAGSNTDEVLTDRAEALLMAADRAQHVQTVIEPALRAGRHVVCDRYIGSSVAYQGYGRGLDIDIVRSISGWAAGGLWPDVTILLTVDEQTTARRTGGARDRIEAAGADFHRRVAEGFAAQAADEDEWWITVDGEGTREEVHERVLEALDEMLGRSLGSGYVDVFHDHDVVPGDEAEPGGTQP